MTAGRRLALGVLVAFLGGVLIVQGVAETRKERWVVEGLRYSAVRYHRGSLRSRPFIHLRTADGRTYLLPERLWKGRIDGADLARRLRADSVVTVEATGGASRPLYGFPRVERLVLPGLTLAMPPPVVAAGIVYLALGPLLVLVGGWIAARAASRRGARPGPGQRITSG